MTISELSPNGLWRYFAEINAIPRASKKEDAIVQYLMRFGDERGLETCRDDVGNVLIRKPASAGYEHRQTVVLQSHVDMVHQKKAEVEFDFSAQGIEMYIEGEEVRAKGTTLGADNGIGVAAALALLSDMHLEHPAIEALFTVDEETGMTGAEGLQPDLLTGKLLINLDTEEDDEITIGCAGGIDITASGQYDPSTFQDGKSATLVIQVSGLKGGHSGIDIDKGFANANKLLIRLLYALKGVASARIVAIDGGGLRNAIPREANATLLLAPEHMGEVEALLGGERRDIEAEYRCIEPKLRIAFSFGEPVGKKMEALDAEFQKRLLASLYALDDGVFRMSPTIRGLVETSNNLARVTVGGGKYEILCLARSSVDSSKKNLVNAIHSVFDLLGAEVLLSGSYPGWTPNPDSALLRTARKVYRENFGQDPKIYACHAGLECGIIGQKYPDIDMISIGPTIRGAHSPDEHVSIPSVQKFWKYLLELLKHTP